MLILLVSLRVSETKRAGKEKKWKNKHNWVCYINHKTQLFYDPINLKKGEERRQDGFLNLVLLGPSGVPYDKKPSIWTFRSRLDPWSGSGFCHTANVDTSTDCTDWLLCHIIPGLSDSLTSGDINTSNRQAELNWLSSEFSLAIDHNGKKNVPLNYSEWKHTQKKSIRHIWY